MHDHLNSIIAAATDQFQEAVQKIRDYVAYAPDSTGGASGPNGANVRRLAARILKDLESLPGRMRPTPCAIHELDGALPVLTAEWHAGDERPTLLIYGHGDVQPANPDDWDTPPHEGVLRDGRLYARGSSDDIGGWMSHLAAIKAWLSVEERLPLNVRLLIEFEEEIGSPNLMRHVDALGGFCDDVDGMVLTDSENVSADTPGLTVSLRGLATADLVCTAGQGGHSGLYGGIYPDPSLALVLSLARLLDRDGRAKVPRVALNEAERRDLAAATGVASKLPDGGRPAAEWVWRQGTITITGTTLPDLTLAKATTPDLNIRRPTNEIKQQVAARLSVRVPPGITADAALAEIERIVTASPPPGIKVALVPVADEGAKVDPWIYDVPDCVAFDAVGRAFEAVWGKPPERIGVGGSIPFVKMFGDRFSDRPLVLTGVLDPDAHLHEPNESLDLKVFHRMILTNVHLLAGLGALPKGGFLAPSQ